MWPVGPSGLRWLAGWVSIGASIGEEVWPLVLWRSLVLYSVHTVDVLLVGGTSGMKGVVEGENVAVVIRGALIFGCRGEPPTNGRDLFPIISESLTGFVSESMGERDTKMEPPEFIWFGNKSSLSGKKMV